MNRYNAVAEQANSLDAELAAAEVKQLDRRVIDRLEKRNACRESAIQDHAGNLNRRYGW